MESINANRMAVNSDLVDSLRRLGLNQYEAKAYGALCLFGSQTAGELAEKAEVARPRVYDVLTALQEKGFVSIQQGRPVCYASLPLGEAVKTLRKQRESSLSEELLKREEFAKSLQPQLKTAPNAPASEERVWTLKGRDAIYSRMNSMISGAKKHVLLASTEEGIRHKIKFHGKDLLKAKDRGVKLHILSPNGDGEAAQIANFVTAKDVPTRMMLTENEALLFLSEPKTKPDDEWGLWLKSPHVVQTLKNALGVKV